LANLHFLGQAIVNYSSALGDEWGISLFSHGSQLNLTAQLKQLLQKDQRRRLRMFWDVQTTTIASESTEISLVKHQTSSGQIVTEDNKRFLVVWSNGVYK